MRRDCLDWLGYLPYTQVVMGSNPIPSTSMEVPSNVWLCKVCVVANILCEKKKVNIKTDIPSVTRGNIIDLFTKTCYITIAWFWEVLKIICKLWFRRLWSNRSSVTITTATPIITFAIIVVHKCLKKIFNYLFGGAEPYVSQDFLCKKKTAGRNNTAWEYQSWI
jgi:hypothetical protein